MKGLSVQQLNKKALSEMMSYVFLIVIAVGLASLVFFFLKGYIIRDSPDCEEGTQLVVTEAKCTYTDPNTNDLVYYPRLTVTLANKGMWTVNGARIGIRKNTDRIATTLTSYTGAGTKETFYILTEKDRDDYAGLNPGETAKPKIFIAADINGKPNAIKSVVTSATSATVGYILEVQPAIIDPKTQQRVMCKKASISQPITCS